MKKILISVLLLAVSACSSTDEGQQLASNSDADAQRKAAGYECKKEKITGSNFPRKVCTTAAQRADSEQNGQDLLRGAGRSNSPVTPAGVRQ